MASKTEMIKDMVEVYQKHQAMLDKFNFNFLYWLDKLKTYEDVRRANSFIFSKMYKHIEHAAEYWNLHVPSVWVPMLAFNQGSEEVKELRVRVNFLKLIWKLRPKVRKIK